MQADDVISSQPIVYNPGTAPVSRHFKTEQLFTLIKMNCSDIFVIYIMYIKCILGCDKLYMYTLSSCSSGIVIQDSILLKVQDQLSNYMYVI